MAFGTWTDGNQLGATDVNTKIVQVLLVSKPSDESVTSSIVSQNDNHLKFTIEPFTNYLVDGMIIVNGADVNGGIEFGWYGPVNAAFDWCSDAFGDNADFTGPVSRTRQQIGNFPQSETNGPTGDDLALPITGILQAGDTGGTFGFRWTQGNSNATATKVKALSALVVQKLV